GGSVGAHFAFTPFELSEIVDTCVAQSQPFLAEQYIFGREAAVAVIGHFRDKDEYVLPVVEIESPKHGVLSYQKRVSGEGYATPGGAFRFDEREKLSQLARA